MKAEKIKGRTRTYTSNGTQIQTNAIFCVCIETHVTAQNTCVVV